MFKETGQWGNLVIWIILCFSLGKTLFFSSAQFKLHSDMVGWVWCGRTWLVHTDHNRIEHLWDEPAWKLQAWPFCPTSASDLKSVLLNEWAKISTVSCRRAEELCKTTNCLKTSANKSWRVTGERCIIRTAESVPWLVSCGPSNRVTWDCAQSSMSDSSVWLSLSVWLLHIKVTFPIKAFVLRHEPRSILGMIIKVETQTMYVSITL